MGTLVDDHGNLVISDYAKANNVTMHLLVQLTMATFLTEVAQIQACIVPGYGKLRRGRRYICH